MSISTVTKKEVTDVGGEGRNRQERGEGTEEGRRALADGRRLTPVSRRAPRELGTRPTGRATEVSLSPRTPTRAVAPGTLRPSTTAHAGSGGPDPCSASPSTASRPSGPSVASPGRGDAGGPPSRRGAVGRRGSRSGTSDDACLRTERRGRPTAVLVGWRSVGRSLGWTLGPGQGLEGVPEGPRSVQVPEVPSVPPLSVRGPGLTAPVTRRAEVGVQDPPPLVPVRAGRLTRFVPHLP